MPRVVLQCCFALFASPLLAVETAPLPREKVRLADLRSAESRKKLLADNGGNEKTEKAVADGLKWLAEKQEKDGSWKFDGIYSVKTASATGFAVLSFLGAGHTHMGDGPYAKTVASGVAALLKLQDEKTGLIMSPRTGLMIYEHAIAALALIEAYALTRDEKLYEPCRKAVDVLVTAHRGKGGWRYDPRYGGSELEGDISVTGWVVQALDTAKRYTDLPVPPEVFKRANDFVERCAKGTKKAEFAYTPGSTPSIARYATIPSGLCSKIALEDWTTDNERLVAGVAVVLKRAPDPTRTNSDTAGGPYDGYYMYYATRAVFHRGDDDWTKTWNPKLQEVLLKRQEKEGCWPADPGTYTRGMGRVGATCLAILALETYYRYPASKKGGK